MVQSFVGQTVGSVIATIDPLGVVIPIIFEPIATPDNHSRSSIAYLDLKA